MSELILAGSLVPEPPVETFAIIRIDRNDNNVFDGRFTRIWPEAEQLLLFWGSSLNVCVLTELTLDNIYDRFAFIVF
jgi:hypothetical protein